MKGLRLEVGFSDSEVQKSKVQNYGSQKAERGKRKSEVEIVELKSWKFRSMEVRKRKAESGSRKCGSRKTEVKKCGTWKCESWKKLFFPSRSPEVGSVEVEKWKLEIKSLEFF